MSAIAGAGKTTFSKKYLEDDNTIRVSRDDIRFHLINADNPNIKTKPYFSEERRVAHEYYKEIARILNSGKNAIGDATQYNIQSIQKTIKNVKKYLLEDIDLHIIVVYLNVPLEKCISNNLKRQGLERVPIHVQREMDSKRSSVKDILKEIPEIDEVLDIQYYYKED